MQFVNPRDRDGGADGVIFVRRSPSLNLAVATWWVRTFFEHFASAKEVRILFKPRDWEYDGTSEHDVILGLYMKGRGLMDMRGRNGWRFSVLEQVVEMSGEVDPLLEPLLEYVIHHQERRGTAAALHQHNAAQNDIANAGVNHVFSVLERNGLGPLYGAIWTDVRVHHWRHKHAPRHSVNMDQQAIWQFLKILTARYMDERQWQLVTNDLDHTAEFYTARVPTKRSPHGEPVDLTVAYLPIAQPIVSEACFVERGASVVVYNNINRDGGRDIGINIRDDRVTRYVRADHESLRRIVREAKEDDTCWMSNRFGDFFARGTRARPATTPSYVDARQLAKKMAGLIEEHVDLSDWHG